MDKLAAFDPEKVLHWRPSCVLQFGETVKGFKPYPFEFQHFAHFLLSRLDDFKGSFGPVARRLALHRHDGGLGIDRSVETAKPFVVRELYTPVWVTGQMSTKSSTRALIFVDGTADIDVGYALLVDDIQPYEQRKWRRVPSRSHPSVRQVDREPHYQYTYCLVEYLD